MEKPTSEGIIMRTLRAHFRAEAKLLHERLVSSAGPIPLRWGAQYANGAGDIEAEKFSMLDPDVEALRNLFSLPDPRPEDPAEDESS